MSQKEQKAIFQDKHVDPIEVPHYVGFWRRAIAFIIDFIFVLLITVFFDFDSISTFFIFYTLYNALLIWSPLQATVGKWIVGAVVTDSDGGTLNFVRSIVRALSIYASAFVLGIGFIMVALNPESKALHDHMSGSMVIEKE